jgi:hypothetical protein
LTKIIQIQPTGEPPENKEQTGISEVDSYSMDQKMAVLMEAAVGKKSLSSILQENNISEEVFYLWKMTYMK